MVDLSSRIKEIRAYTGLSQEKFAEKISLSRSTLALIETGKSTPGYETLTNICSNFKILPAYFFDEGNVVLSTYIGAAEYAAKAANRVGADVAEIFDSPRYRANYGALEINNLKRELSTKDSSLLELYNALDELDGLIKILGEFFPYISIENPSNISLYMSKPTASLAQLNSNLYTTNIISYLNGIRDHATEIISFKNSLVEFLKAMKQIDRDETIPSYV